MSRWDATTRLAQQVEVSTDGCLLWTGRVDKGGYGRMMVAGRTYGVHRVAWLLAFGSLPELLDHICHDPRVCPGGACSHRRCCNVEHLRPATRQENGSSARSRTAESNRARAQAITHCPQGHEYTPENTRIDKGGRHCRTCDVVHRAASNLRRRVRVAA